jgi:hypothetical protein
MVYQLKSSDYDSHIRTGVRNKKGVLDILEYEVIKEKWTAVKKGIKDMNDEEIALRTAAEKTAGSDEAAKDKKEADDESPQKNKKQVSTRWTSCGRLS